MKLALTIIIQFIVISTFCQNKVANENIFDEIKKIQTNVGKKYVHFNKKSLMGKAFSNKDLKDKITLINFWFEGCLPCVAEFPQLNKLFQKFSTNTKFQLISFTPDSIKSAVLTVQKFNLAFPVLPVTEKECWELNFNSGFPTTIIVDANGKVYSIKIGGSMDKRIIENNFREIDTILEQCLSQ